MTKPVRDEVYLESLRIKAGAGPGNEPSIVKNQDVLNLLDEISILKKENADLSEQVDSSMNGYRQAEQQYSEKSQSDQILQQINSRHNSLISNITDVIAIIGPDGLVKYKSPNLKKWFGWLPEERMGTDAMATIHPDDKERMLKEFQNIMVSQGMTITSEFRYECKDGSYKPVEVTAVNLFADPDINGILMNYRDITDRKKEEEAQQESESRFRLMSDSAPVLIWEAGIDSLCTYFNKSWLEFTGRTIEQEKGNGWTEGVHPDDLLTCLSIYTESFNSRVQFSMEYRLRRSDGEYRWLLDTGAPRFTDNGVFSGYVGSCIDISDIKHAEQILRVSEKRFEELVEHTGVFAWEIDKNGLYTYINQTSRSVIGYEPDEIIGKKYFYELHPKEGRQQFKEGAFAAFEQKLSFRGLENPVECKDGKIITVATNGLPVLDKTGNLIGYKGTDTDITELKTSETKLLKAKEEAEASNQAKSVFLANMSHEIRTPMNAIIGFSQLMAREPLTTRQKEYLASINRSSEHLLKLINDILELSKIEAGRQILNPTNTDLNALFKEISNMFRELALTKGLHLIFESRSDVPRYVVVDANKLRQILINLIGNAIKFTEEGGIAVRSSVRTTEDKKSILVVEIQDSGAGISENDLSKLFQQFEQASAGIKLSSGAGLGLALSRKLANLMNGDIKVTSQEGIGSLFTFYVEIQEGRAEPNNTKITRHVTGIANPRDNYRILVVDDLDDNLTVAVKLLNLAGFITNTARNGREAIEISGKWAPHLILMDLRMPVMDGYEAARQIKATPKGRLIPILAVTASQFAGEKAREFSSDFNGYIRKPFRESELFTTIGDILEINFLFGETTEERNDSGYSYSTEEIRQALDKLPEETVSQMYMAVEISDFYKLIELIKDIEANDIELARHLLSYANNFDHRYLQKLFRNTGGR